jgi:hypothetical protein
MDIPAILISQYQASLEMLKQTITSCPESLWNAASDKNKFWHVAYHALYFTHEYLADSPEAFTPWIKHRDGYEDFFEEPQVGEPYDKDAILEYLAFCQQEVAERVPRLNLEEGFDEIYTPLELQIYSIRHIMQHTGELMERVGPREGVQIDWVGSNHG